MFAALTLAAVVALLGVVMHSYEAIRDRVLGDETPQQMTVAELLTRGVGANRHVTLTDVAVGRDFVMSSGIAERKNPTYLVIAPAGTAPGTPGKSIVVHVTRFQDYEEAKSNPRQSTYTGIFTPDESIAPTIRQMLGEKYPGLALDRIPYLEVRDYKGTSGFRRAFFFGAAAVPLMAVGIGGMMLMARQSKIPAAPAQASQVRKC